MPNKPYNTKICWNPRGTHQLAHPGEFNKLNNKYIEGHR